jgi:RND family efflux transporter MFP subunit
MRALVIGLSFCGLLANVALADAPLVKIIQTERTGGTVERTFFGRVVARETIDLAFQVTGQVVEFPLEEGAVVPKGALVARLDLEPFELQRDQAAAQNAQAARAVERYSQLSGNAVSQVARDDAQTQLDLTTISLRNAQRSLGEATLTAPFDALVAARLVPNFSTVSAGSPVVRLHDMSDLRVEISVPEVLAQRSGPQPNVTFEARFPGHDTGYALELREFNAETDAVGQTFSITLGMAPPDDLVVLPGSSAEVRATLDVGQSVIEIPNSAVLIGNDGSTSVMVFSPAGADEGTVSLTPVEITPSMRGAVEVASGLEAGQEIIATGLSALSDGDTVRRFTGFTN